MTNIFLSDIIKLQNNKRDTKENKNGCRDEAARKEGTDHQRDNDLPQTILGKRGTDHQKDNDLPQTILRKRGTDHRKHKRIRFFIQKEERKHDDPKKGFMNQYQTRFSDMIRFQES